MIVSQLKDWAPIRVHWDRGFPVVNWCYLGQERFVEPFFEQTIEKRLRTPFNLLFQYETSLNTLLDLQEVEPGLPPTGFIFHMSRCGSTLVAQMLASLAQNIVISEAGPIDSVLRANWHDPSITSEQRIAWLRALLSALSRQRRDAERHFYVKFDSWHTLELPLIQQAFPDVPWIFLYRDPVQVLVSHQRQRGGQMVQSILPPRWLGLDQAAIDGVSTDEYSALVLKRICAEALEHLDHNPRLVNYSQLPAAVWSEIATHFGVNFSPAALDEMRKTTHFDAKNPGLTFVADSLDKENMAAADLRRLAENKLVPVYAALEAKRQNDEAVRVPPTL